MNLKTILLLALITILTFCQSHSQGDVDAKKKQCDQYFSSYSSAANVSAVSFTSVDTDRVNAFLTLFIVCNQQLSELKSKGVQTP